MLNVYLAAMCIASSIDELDELATAQARTRLELAAARERTCRGSPVAYTQLEPHPLQGSAGGAQRLSCCNVAQATVQATAQARTRLELAAARERTCRGLRPPWVAYTQLDSSRFFLG